MNRRIKLDDIGREPFRVFFPAGVLSGILGVALWPLYFTGCVRLYPGPAHAHIMAFGLFGAFILGFLGTALPRLLSAQPLGIGKVALLLALHLAMVASYAAQSFIWGDSIFLILLALFLFLMARRAIKRQDTPPPGFILVLLAFVCVLAGTVLDLLRPWMDETGASWVMLSRLLCYQGFILLPILGVGPFLLPRFFGMPSRHSFDEMLKPSPPWKRKAALALAAGLLIVASFFMEVRGWLRAAHALRFAATLSYLWIEFPFRSAPGFRTALGACLRIALGCIVAGFLLIAFFPAFRVSLLHLTLIGGFAVITFTVATRVLFGHSGNLDQLKRKNRWLIFAVSVMLFAMATRVSGDFWPKITASHYTYGALLWIAAVLLWAAYALPKILQVEAEDPSPPGN